MVSIKCTRLCWVFYWGIRNCSDCDPVQSLAWIGSQLKQSLNVIHFACQLMQNWFSAYWLLHNAFLLWIMTDCFSTVYWLLINLSFFLCAQALGTDSLHCYTSRSRLREKLWQKSFTVGILSCRWQMSYSCSSDEHTRVDTKITFYSIFNH